MQGRQGRSRPCEPAGHGLATRPGAGGVSSREMTTAPPRQITTDADLDAALAAPRFLLFKHSLICPVSTAAFREYTAFVAAFPDVPTAWIDVIGSRPLARRIAEATGVRHESPQALWLMAGRAKWNASHAAIKHASLAAHARG